MFKKVFQYFYKNYNFSLSNMLDMVNYFAFKKIDYGDIYLQNRVSETWTLENNGNIKNIYQVDQGVGVRTIIGNKTCLCFSNDLKKNNIISLVLKANQLDNYTQKNIIINNMQSKKLNYMLIPNKSYPGYFEKELIHSSLNSQKINMLYFLKKFLKKIEKRINYINIRLFVSYDYICILSTKFNIACDLRPLIDLSIVIQVEDKLKTEIGYSTWGGRYSYKTFLCNKYQNFNLLECLSWRAVKRAINNLYAVHPPCGVYPVILGPGSTGVLLHEAIGHSLEADFNQKKLSVFSDCLDKKIISSLCTIIDDSTIYGARGSFCIDDEGIISQKTVLVQNGILKNYLLDEFNARLLGLSSTGNARRESYAYLPLPRMTNTYLLSGISSLSDMIQSVDNGIYITQLGSGEVDIVSGKFVFTITSGFIIKNGKLNKSIKGATVIGTGKDIMNNISMLGNDLEIDNGIGWCGKEGQLVSVSVGQPSMKIESMIVGGRDNK